MKAKGELLCTLNVDSVPDYGMSVQFSNMLPSCPLREHGKKSKRVLIRFLLSTASMFETP